MLLRSQYSMAALFTKHSNLNKIKRQFVPKSMNVWGKPVSYHPSKLSRIPSVLFLISPAINNALSALCTYFFCRCRSPSFISILLLFKFCGGETPSTSSSPHQPVPNRGIPCTQKLKSSMLREVLESGVGKILTLRASCNARIFAFLIFAFSLHSTSFYS